ncbi:hypothetical protein YC2023_019687 [Brassica napus]
MSLEEMMEFDCSKDFVVFPNLQRVSLLANNIRTPFCECNGVINFTRYHSVVSIRQLTTQNNLQKDDDETAETVEQNDNDDETAVIEEMEKPFVFSDQPTR